MLLFLLFISFASPFVIFSNIFGIKKDNRGI
jgi:hypothetical protein